MKKFIHKIYIIIGQILNALCRAWWNIRDKVSPPSEDAILFVAHPDDDTLFFHSFIKEHKPYVVLLTTGWSLRRYPCFKKVMKSYGVKYRAYNLKTRDTRINVLEKYVKQSFDLGDFKICATHNADGEYGHEMHIRVHNVVKANVSCDLFVPVLDCDIEKHPLNNNLVDEKTIIFEKYYTTELFVLEQYSKWVKNEKLIQEKK